MIRIILILDFSSIFPKKSFPRKRIPLCAWNKGFFMIFFFEKIDISMRIIQNTWKIIFHTSGIICTRSIMFFHAFIRKKVICPCASMAMYDIATRAQGKMTFFLIKAWKNMIKRVQIIPDVWKIFFHVFWIWIMRMEISIFSKKIMKNPLFHARSGMRMRGNDFLEK